MDENGLPITGAGVDYSRVEPLNQRELITYFNMFLVRTCTFLNNFSTKCESKLAHLHGRLDSIDTSITLLETKLNSVEELKDLKLENTTSATATAPVSTEQNVPTSSQSVPQAETAAVAAAPPPPPPEPEKPAMTVSQDPRYAGYFRMQRLGVHESAIKLKMRSEGANPDLLDTPDAPAPPPDQNDDAESESD